MSTYCLAGPPAPPAPPPPAAPPPPSPPYAPPAPAPTDYTAGWQVNHFLEPGEAGGITASGTLWDFGANSAPQESPFACADSPWQPTLKGEAVYDPATRSIALGGSTDYVDLGNSTCVYGINGVTIAITLWAAELSAGTRFFDFYGTGAYANANSPILSQYEPGGGLRFYHAWMLSNVATGAAAAGLVPQQWVTLVYTSARNDFNYAGRMYVNGVLINPSVGAMDWSYQWPRQGYLGRPHPSSPVIGGVTPLYFNGKIAQFQVRSRRQGLTE